MDEKQLLAAEPIDPDVSLRTDSINRTGPVREGVEVGVVAIGGVVGAAVRYEVGLWWPAAMGRFPWATWTINVAGCALIGVLLVLVSDVFTGRPLLRPLLGTGVLSGFTTFSTFAVDIQRQVTTGHAGLALGYLAATAMTAMAAVGLATRLTRFVVEMTRR